MIILNIKTDLSGLNSLQALLAHPAPVLDAGSRAIGNDLRSHFRARNAEGNKRGWPRTNFWSKIRSQVAEMPATDTEGKVVIAAPELAQKIYGGTITPKRGKFLALPMTAEAKKAGSPREGGMADLFIINCLKFGGGLWLARNKGKGKRAALELQYKLVPSVTQAPDPRALPPPETLETSAGKAAETIIGRVLRGGGAS